VFNSSWLAEPCINWLARDGGSVHNAWCRLCMKSFKLGTMGKKARESHMASEKHKSIISVTSIFSALHTFLLICLLSMF
jgi:hypothetical protein